MSSSPAVHFGSSPGTGRVRGELMIFVLNINGFGFWRY